MKFSVGYSLLDSNQFNYAVEEFKSELSEIYFSWPGMPSGRINAIEDEADYTRRVETLLDDLKWYSGIGLPLVVLFNANCYGETAVSKTLSESVCSTIDYICGKVTALSAVTTASPFLAFLIKKEFPHLQIRASVNMRIFKSEGMEYLSDRFDFFYIAKELNRNIKEIKILKDWADNNGKGIGILVNSGCLNYCSNQTFHDNLVAHEQTIKDFDPNYYQPVQCRNFLSNRNKWNHLLSGSNWIRPEDLSEYEKLFDSVKLATRMHSNPYMVLAAYSSRVHKGNILDLTEPGFSQMIAPEIIENESFPDGWSAHPCSTAEADLIMKQVLKRVQ